MFQFETISKNMKLKEDYKRLQFLLSDESLTLLPEYQQRIQVRVYIYYTIIDFIGVDLKIYLPKKVIFIEAARLR